MCEQAQQSTSVRYNEPYEADYHMPLTLYYSLYSCTLSSQLSPPTSQVSGEVSRRDQRRDVGGWCVWSLTPRPCWPLTHRTVVASCRLSVRARRRLLRLGPVPYLSCECVRACKEPPTVAIPHEARLARLHMFMLPPAGARRAVDSLASNLSIS